MDTDSGTATGLFEEKGSVYSADLHPEEDGVVFVSNRTGRREVYPAALEQGGFVHLVSSGGGHSPHWSPDGKTIDYLHRTTSELWSVAVRLGTARPELDRPRRIRSSFHWDRNVRTHYDIAKDGRILTPVVDGWLDQGRKISLDSSWR